MAKIKLLHTIERWWIYRKHSNVRHYDLFGQRIIEPVNHNQVCFICNKIFNHPSKVTPNREKG